MLSEMGRVSIEGTFCPKSSPDHAQESPVLMVVELPFGVWRNDCRVFRGQFIQDGEATERWLRL